MRIRSLVATSSWWMTCSPPAPPPPSARGCCAARRASVLGLKGVARAEEENGHFLPSTRFTTRVPSVIRLLEYRRIPHQTRALSRKNILLRDRNTCQYCCKVMSSGELTLDHVM